MADLRLNVNVRSSLAASIISSTYGLDVRPENDPNIERAEKALDNFKHAAIAGLYLVDVLPFLKHVPSWMPGAGFKRFAEKSRPDTIDMLNAPFIEGCNRIVSGFIKELVFGALMEFQAGGNE